MDDLFHFISRTPDIMATAFIIVVGTLAAILIVLYFIDAGQTRNAIRHNFPVLGRFRFVFIKLGEFFRQYLFAQDREELPFNRAERTWIAESAKGNASTVAFGSTRPIDHLGTIVFRNSPFPVQNEEIEPTPLLTLGKDCPNPYQPASFFNISGMSYGALSAPAITALSHGANLANCWLNTGEGGLSEHHLSGQCDLVFQIGTAKYGIRNQEGKLDEARLQEIANLRTVKMFEIKLSQGAKPGKGGILPAHKVTREIAKIRNIPVNQDSLSPNRHEEIGSNTELIDFINKVRDLTQKPTGIKFVLGDPGWLDAFFQGIINRGTESAPDFITLDGGEGGTGAAPMPLIDAVGLSISQSLPILVEKLEKYDLRDRIRVIASGKLITPVEVAWAMAEGADFINSARGFMFSLGCIQAMRCHKNTCPTGITTHNPRLQKGLDPKEKSSRVAAYVDRVRQGVETIAYSCGVVHARHLDTQHVTRVGRPHAI